MANSQALQFFDFGSKNIRALTIDNEPWFVAADVCEILEVNNSRQAVARLDDDEKGVISNDTPGGQQDMTIVNEPGLYTLILGSRKPEARQFKRWITHEVLPAIRQTGSYQNGTQPQILDCRFYPFDLQGRHWVARLKPVLYLAVQPLAGLLGLDWSQWEPRLEVQYARFGIVGLSGHIPGAAASTSLAARLDQTPELLSFFASEVPPDRQELLEFYRRELADTLRINWQTRHPLTRASLLLDEPLSAEQQNGIKTAIRARLVGSEFKQAGILYLYGRLKTRFRVPKWTDIRRGDYDAAMELIATDDGRELLRTIPKLALLPPVGAVLSPVKRP